MSEHDAENDAPAVNMVIRDGKVAILVSPNYGAGWSTWADHPEAALYAPDVVEWVEAGKPAIHTDIDTAFRKYGYMGGLSDVRIEWLPIGTRFVIDEYDGFESLIILSPDFGYVAGTCVTPSGKEQLLPEGDQTKEQ